jgi:hypothetical protein
MFPIEVIEAAAAGDSAPASVSNDPTLSRDFEILAKRFKGETLEDIGSNFGLTRERARQIIASRAGSEYKKYKLIIAAKEAERRAQEIQSICASIKEKPGVDWTEILEIHPNTKITRKDIPSSIAKLVREVRKSPLAGGRQWSDEEVFAAIVEAATHYFPLAKANYDYLLSMGAINGPSTASIMVRFNSWSNACHLAGVECFTPNTHYAKSWSDSELIQFVVSFILSESESSAMNHYEKWRSQQVNETPSSATIRVSFNGWSETLILAFESLRSTWSNDV